MIGADHISWFQIRKLFILKSSRQSYDKVVSPIERVPHPTSNRGQVSSIPPRDKMFFSCEVRVQIKVIFIHNSL